MRVSKRVLDDQASTRGARKEGVHLRGERVVTAYCARSVGPILGAMLGESGIVMKALVYRRHSEPGAIRDMRAVGPRTIGRPIGRVTGRMGRGTTRRAQQHDYFKALTMSRLWY